MKAFYLNAINQQDSCPDILQCHQSLIWEGCYKCESMDAGSKCETCNSGYKSNGHGGCVVCSSDECCPENTISPVTSHCVACDTDSKSCRICEEGYSNTEGVCKKPKKTEEISAGAIVGISIGVLAFVGIVLFLVIHFIIIPYRKKRTRSRLSEYAYIEENLIE